jgi:hypothetical protein
MPGPPQICEKGSAIKKYRPFEDYLYARTGKATLTFKQIETILGDRLPPSALTVRWWHDSGTPQWKAWTRAGWRVVSVDCLLGFVILTQSPNGLL